MKAVVSRRAFIARLQRHLARNDELLRKARSPKSVQQNGLFFIVNDTNNLHHSFQSFEELEAFAREAEVLESWEVVEVE